MIFHITSNWLPWIVTVVMSFVLSQYLNQLLLEQDSIQVNYSHYSKYNKVFKAVVTNDYRLNVSNGTMSEQSTKEPVIQTNNEDLSTPVQLKDFGMFAKNRRVR